MKVASTFTPRTLLTNFAPWIVYGILGATGHGSLAYAGGLIISLFQFFLQWRRRRVKLLDGVTLLFFAAGVVSIFALRSTFFLKNSSVLSWSAFAVVAWVSLLAGSPFTAQYARDSVPKEYWDNPGFRRVNVVITAVWGVVFVINAALAALMALKLSGVPERVGVVFQALPYIILIFGIVFTNRYPQYIIRKRSTHTQPG